MQIKITMRYDLTSVRIAFIKRTSDKYSWLFRENRTIIHC
jgi:hypothetical protein